MKRKCDWNDWVEMDFKVVFLASLLLRVTTSQSPIGYSEFTSDADGHVTVGSDVTFYVTGTQEGDRATYYWSYNASTIATVVNAVNEQLTFTSSDRRTTVSATREPLDSRTTNMNLTISDLTLGDSNQTLFVEALGIITNATLYVKECPRQDAADFSVQVSRALGHCGLGCTANFTCNTGLEGSFYGAQCQRNATWSQDYPVCTPVFCNTTDLELCPGCSVPPASVRADVIVRFQACPLGGHAVCLVSGAWEVFCNTDSCQVVPEVSCSTPCGDKCPVRSTADHVTTNGVVELSCPPGCIGNGSAICGVEGGFVGAGADCVRAPCTSGALVCGDGGLLCPVLTPQPLFGDQVTASCPPGHTGHVSATCGANDAYTDVVAFCQIADVVSGGAVVAIVLGIFAVALAAGLLTGYVVAVRQPYGKMGIVMTKWQKLCVILSSLVFGFAFGFFLGHVIAQQCTYDNNYETNSAQNPRKSETYT